jgi:hypothetical protein
MASKLRNGGGVFMGAGSHQLSCGCFLFIQEFLPLMKHDNKISKTVKI